MEIRMSPVGHADRAPHRRRAGARWAGLSAALSVLGLVSLPAPVAWAVRSGWSQPPLRYQAVWPIDPPHIVLRGYAPPPVPWLPGHRGVDLVARPGQAVHAVADGVVGYAGLLAGRSVITVVHGGVRTTYEPVTPLVAVGSRVAAGARIGHLEDRPGHCGDRHCLHWGLVRGVEYLNPLALLRRGPSRLLPVWPAGSEAAPGGTRVQPGGALPAPFGGPAAPDTSAGVPPVAPVSRAPATPAVPPVPGASPPGGPAARSPHAASAPGGPVALLSSTVGLLLDPRISVPGLTGAGLLGLGLHLVHLARRRTRPDSCPEPPDDDPPPEPEPVLLDPTPPATEPAARQLRLVPPLLSGETLGSPAPSRSVVDLAAERARRQATRSDPPARAA